MVFVTAVHGNEVPLKVAGLSRKAAAFQTFDHRSIPRIYFGDKPTATKILPVALFAYFHQRLERPRRGLGNRVSHPGSPRLW